MPTPLLPALVLASLFPNAAGDWPQYNGPTGARSATDVADPVAWGADGPALLWRAPTTAGFSSFVVAGGRAFTLVTLAEAESAREACLALDARSGEELWSVPVGAASYDGGGDAGTDDNKGGDGPRSTPSADGERVYVYTGDLRLVCLSAADGKELWSHDVAAEYEGRNVQWPNATSPLVEGGLVLVAGGGAGRSLLAFDKESGALAWAKGDETLTHASPIAATVDGTRMAIFFVRSGLVALDPATGDERWRQAYDFRTSTAASPVVFETVVYVSAGYGVGAGAFVILKEDGSFKTDVLWRKRNDLMNHWSTPLCHEGFLYGMFGFKEYGETPLQCVELSTGEVRWSKEGFGPGNCILVGNTLVALSDAGEVVLVEATPEAYRERARADVLDGKCWSSPAYADGRLYVRSTREGACLALSADAR